MEGVEAGVVEAEQVSDLIKLIMEEKRDVVLAVFLVVAGIVFLLNNVGVVPWEVWSQILIFWPVLLVLGGVRVLLGRGWLADLIMVALTVLILGSIVLIALNTVGVPILFFRW